METVRFSNYANFPSPFQEMERMKSEMDRIFAGLMGQSPLTADSGVFSALNVIEDSAKVLVHAELPGVKPEDIEISVEGNTLSLRGERRRDDVAM
jgi:HSP20 family protein